MVVDDVGGDDLALVAQEREDLRQVLLALGVVGADARERLGERGLVEAEDPRVDLADLRAPRGSRRRGPWSRRRARRGRSPDRARRGRSRWRRRGSWSPWSRRRRRRRGRRRAPGSPARTPAARRPRGRRPGRRARRRAARRARRRRCRRGPAGSRYACRPAARRRGPRSARTPRRRAPLRPPARRCTGHATIGRPQISCRTLGVAERIRVPCPAAITTAVKEVTGRKARGRTAVTTGGLGFEPRLHGAKGRRAAVTPPPKQDPPTGVCQLASSVRSRGCRAARGGPVGGVIGIEPEGAGVADRGEAPFGAQHAQRAAEPCRGAQDVVEGGADEREQLRLRVRERDQERRAVAGRRAAEQDAVGEVVADGGEVDGRERGDVGRDEQDRAVVAGDGTRAARRPSRAAAARRRRRRRAPSPARARAARPAARRRPRGPATRAAPARPARRARRGRPRAARAQSKRKCDPTGVELRARDVRQRGGERRGERLRAGLDERAPDPPPAPPRRPRRWRSRSRSRAARTGSPPRRPAPSPAPPSG